MKESIVLNITESSQAGEARRTALSVSSRLGFDETERGKVGIVVTELANNLLQHAGGGTLLLRSIHQGSTAGIEILTLDKGPGMRDVEACLEDGFSTAGTLGNGLGALNRLSSLCEIYSLPGKGTAVLVQIWAQPVAKPSQQTLEVGVVCLPKSGQEVSGDAWASEVDYQRTLLLVADGLGHGPAAASASSEAVRMFRTQHHRSPQAIVEATHAALRSTRGAALAIAEVDFDQQLVRFSGIGNIAAAVFWPTGHQNMVSHNGTVGHEVRKIQEFTYTWYAGGVLIMHSDGLATQWQLDRYPGLSQKHPSIIAGILYRDFNRDRDDITVLAAKATGI